MMTFTFKIFPTPIDQDGSPRALHETDLNEGQ